jgi:hypothetical protein
MGKDTVAELLRDMYGFNFMSSSRAAMMEAVWPVIGEEYYGKCEGDVDAAIEACFEDRVNRREEWKRLISEYNSPDKSKLTKHVFNQVDIYVGMRCALEYQSGVNQRLFDKVLWVHRPSYPTEPEMDISYDPHSMIAIVNSGSLDLLRDQLRKVFGPETEPPPEEVYPRAALGL